MSYLDDTGHEPGDATSLLVVDGWNHDGSMCRLSLFSINTGSWGYLSDKAQGLVLHELVRQSFLHASQDTCILNGARHIDGHSLSGGGEAMVLHLRTLPMGDGAILGEHVANGVTERVARDLTLDSGMEWFPVMPWTFTGNDEQILSDIGSDTEWWVMTSASIQSSLLSLGIHSQAITNIDGRWI